MNYLIQHVRIGQNTVRVGSMFQLIIIIQHLFYLKTNKSNFTIKKTIKSYYFLKILNMAIKRGKIL